MLMEFDIYAKWISQYVDTVFLVSYIGYFLLLFLNRFVVLRSNLQVSYKPLEVGIISSSGVLTHYSFVTTNSGNSLSCKISPLNPLN